MKKINFVKNTTNRIYVIKYKVADKQKMLKFYPKQITRVIDKEEVNANESFKTLLKSGKLVKLNHIEEVIKQDFTNLVDYLHFDVDEDKVTFTIKSTELAGEEIVLYVNYNGSAQDPQFVSLNDEGIYNGVLPITAQTEMFEVAFFNKFLSSEADTFLEIIDYPVALTHLHRVYV